MIAELGHGRIAKLILYKSSNKPRQQFFGITPYLRDPRTVNPQRIDQSDEGRLGEVLDRPYTSAFKNVLLKDRLHLENNYNGVKKAG